MNFVLFFYLHPFCSFCSYDCQSCHKTKKNKNGNSSKWLKKYDEEWTQHKAEVWKVEEAGHEKWIAIIGRNIIWWWSSLYYSMIEISIEKNECIMLIFLLSLSIFFIHSTATLWHRFCRCYLFITLFFSFVQLSIYEVWMCIIYFYLLL